MTAPLHPITQAEADAIRHKMIQYIIAAFSALPEPDDAASAPITPTRRAAHTPDKCPDPAASPAAEEVAS